MLFHPALLVSTRITTRQTMFTYNIKDITRNKLCLQTQFISLIHFIVNKNLIKFLIIIHNFPNNLYHGAVRDNIIRCSNSIELTVSFPQTANITISQNKFHNLRVTLIQPSKRRKGASFLHRICLDVYSLSSDITR